MFCGQLNHHTLPSRNGSSQADPGLLFVNCQPFNIDATILKAATGDGGCASAGSRLQFRMGGEDGFQRVRGFDLIGVGGINRELEKQVSVWHVNRVCFGHTMGANDIEISRCVCCGFGVSFFFPA